MTQDPNAEAAADRHIVVVGPEGEPIGSIEPAEQPETSAEADRKLTELVEQPAKVMRVGSMIKQLLDEVKDAPLDEAARARLRLIHQRSIKELEDGLAPELIEELERLSLPFSDEDTPSEAELRIAHAQLVGWLEGLFHGIQTALFAQQMAARAAFDEMRRRAVEGGQPEGAAGPQMTVDPRKSTGPYL